MDILSRIKRLVARDRFVVSNKATNELEADALTPDDAAEAILNAQTIKKTLRSRRIPGGEKLYVIESFNYSGTLIYTKGKIARQAGEEVFYFLVSSKRSTFSH